MLSRHHEVRGRINAAASELFEYLDRHDRLAGHMTTSSWMMAGARMQVRTDDVQGRAGDVRLLVIGPYRMGFDITPAPAGSVLRVFIDYELPARGISAILGRLLGPFYARWCTGSMHADAVKAFQHADHGVVAEHAAISQS